MYLFELMPLEEALNIINSVKVKKDTEKINLENAYNRVLAENITAPFNSPSFDRSAW